MDIAATGERSEPPRARQAPHCELNVVLGSRTKHGGSTTINSNYHVCIERQSVSSKGALNFVSGGERVWVVLIREYHIPDAHRGYYTVVYSSDEQHETVFRFRRSYRPAVMAERRGVHHVLTASDDNGGKSSL